MAEQAAALSRQMLQKNYIGPQAHTRVGPGMDYYNGGRRLVKRTYADGSTREYFKYYTPQQQAKRHASARAYRLKNIEPRFIQHDEPIPCSNRPDFSPQTETPEFDDHGELDYALPPRIGAGIRCTGANLYCVQFSRAVTELQSLAQDEINALLLKEEGIHPIQYHQPGKNANILHAPEIPPFGVDLGDMRLYELFDSDAPDKGMTLFRYAQKYFPGGKKFDRVKELDPIIKDTVVPQRISQTQEFPRKLHARDELLGLSNVKIYVPQGLGKSTCKAKWPDRVGYWKDNSLNNVDIFLTNRVKDCHPKDTIVVLPTYHRFMANRLSRSVSFPSMCHKEYMELSKVKYLKILIPDNAFLSDIILALDDYFLERMPYELR